MPFYTENGWPQCSSADLDRSPIPGIDIVIPLQKGPPSIILKAFCADYHLFVESLYNARGGTDEGGWTPTNSVRTSNHLSGSAVDLNWSDHPFKVRGTFSASQMETLRELLAYYEDTVFWGGDWRSPIDEMHHQLHGKTYGNPKTQDFIDRKIRSDGFSFFRKADEGPGVERKPVTPSDGGTYWADVSQYQGHALNDNYPYGVFSFRTNSGDKVDALAAANAAIAKGMLDAENQFDLVIPYYFFRPGQANCDLHRKILEDAGLWNHPHTVTMVDVESDRGAITGDHSTEINDEVNRVRGWYGNLRRVVGYWNPNADPGLWVRRPYALELVIPQYGREPGDLTGVKDNLAVREAFAHQYTDNAQGVPPWLGKPVDLNWAPYTISELMELFGITTPLKPADGGELDLSAAELGELCAAIAAQFTA
jgi:D-alanyl-D-alanine carboxypeptidase